MLTDRTSTRSTRAGFTAAGAAAFASIGFVRTPARAAQFQIKCATDLTVDHPVNVGFTQMWRAIERESGGRVAAQIFSNSVLGGESSMFEQTRQGAISVFLAPPGVVAQITPVADIAYLGFAYKDQDEGMRVFQGPLGDYIRTQVAAKGLFIPKVSWDAGMQQVGIGASWHPIRTPDDMRGFKIRVPPSAILVGMMKELGANGVSLSVSETYTSLQTKLIDGMASQLATIEAFRFYEVTKYLSLTSHVWGTFFLLVNGDYWKTVPSDIQAIIERNNAKYAIGAHRNMVLMNATYRDKLARQGLAINAVDRPAFRDHLHAYYQYWANTFGPTVWSLLQTAIGQKLT